MDSLQPSDRARCDAHHHARFATELKDVLQSEIRGPAFGRRSTAGFPGVFCPVLAAWSDLAAHLMCDDRHISM